MCFNNFPIFRTQTVNAAIAEAERIRLIGTAEAQALEAIGVSEAQRMQMKAAVYKKYGGAAILNIALNALPKVRDRSLARDNRDIIVYYKFVYYKRIL